MRAGPILVVDDDAEVRLVVRLTLERAGWSITEASSGGQALEAVASAGPPELVVLNVGLPDMDGLEVLAQVRRTSNVPVILLTARATEPERVFGLHAGADDYLAKPFSPRELAARVAAVLRRQPARPVVFTFDDLVIDTGVHEVRCAGAPVRLTAKEFDLLRFLAESPRQVFTKAELLQHVWDALPGWQTEATVSEHVHRLRRKVEHDPKHPTRIVTVRGGGYCFEP